MSVLYNDEIADRICELLQQGLTPTEITARRGMPTRRQFYSWLQRYPDFARATDRARQQSVHTHIALLKTIAEKALKADNAVQVAGLRLAKDCYESLARYANPAHFSTTNQKAAEENASKWLAVMESVSGNNKGKKSHIDTDQSNVALQHTDSTH